MTEHAKNHIFYDWNGDEYQINALPIILYDINGYKQTITELKRFTDDNLDSYLLINDNNEPFEENDLSLSPIPNYYDEESEAYGYTNWGDLKIVEVDSLKDGSFDSEKGAILNETIIFEVRDDDKVVSMFSDIRIYYNASAGKYYAFNPKRFNYSNHVDYKKLITRIANRMAKNILNDTYKQDKVYLSLGDKSFTKTELVNELTTQSEVGLKLIENIILLAFELVLRDKEKIDNVKILK